jgi:Flp pilus assembly pilin Flp
MLTWVLALLCSEAGQDLTEYTLLMLFVMLASVGIFMGMGGNIAGIVTQVNSELITANSSAS